MFCPKCGHQLSENARFCGNCGASVTPPAGEPLTPPAAVQKEPEIPPAVPQPAPQESSGPSAAPGGKKKHSPLPWILGSMAVVALAIGGYFGYRTIHTNIQYQAAMQDGAAALEKGKYSQAEKYYTNALALHSDSIEATDGLKEAIDGLNRDVLQQAEQYLLQEDFAQACGLLSELALDSTATDYERYSALLSVARMSPDIVRVDVDSFPLVSVTLSCGSTGLTAEDITVMDNNLSRDLCGFKLEDGQIVLSYESDDVEYESVHHSLTVELRQAGFTFQRTSDYDTPHYEPATVKLVSTDVSAYPLIRAYFRVEQADDGATVQGLSERSFQIQERLQGGAYLAREVRMASPLESLGLNIGLVADKSSSINQYDMERIKTVMTEFVRNLHYTAGDKAEVLAFDDIVQQMCCFTDESALLINGISNMSSDGLTAFYDAVYAGIQNASLQGGARCVIAFTDGMDNRSIHTPADVIDYASTKQVPVYIIGVGDYVETNALQKIANSTGGRYWFINDLYDLQEIFNQVYAEQKELYMVEYVSDPAADPYASRELIAEVSGNGYKGETTAGFTPAFSTQGLTHTSRYELVPGTCTWEEANRRCQEMGGHLATITSQEELNQIIALAEENDCKYVWLGGYTSYDYDGNVFGHWVTGEEFSFQAWSDGQPSRKDLDGTPEWYIMLWYVRNTWSWNDQRNDPASVSNALNQNMCFICEYED